jgi:hypothetical protein
MRAKFSESERNGMTKSLHQASKTSHRAGEGATAGEPIRIGRSIDRRLRSEAPTLVLPGPFRYRFSRECGGDVESPRRSSTPPDHCGCGTILR